MMEADLVKEDDPGMLAMELAAPVVVMIAKVYRQPECEKKMLKTIKKHIQHFCDEYINGKDK